MSFDRTSSADPAALQGNVPADLPPLPEGLRERLVDCRSLPSLPAAALRVIMIARSPEPCLTDFAKAIEQDPALTLRLIGLANSALYARGGSPVATSRDAVSRIGLDATLATAMSFGLPRAQSGPLEYDYFCQRAVIAATAAQQLAQSLCPGDAGSLFTAALLQDIGILAFAAIDGDSYAEYIPGLRDHSALRDAEQLRYGCDHGVVGAWLAASWGVPLSLAVAIHECHGPLRDGDPRRLCLRLSGIIADFWLSHEAAGRLSKLMRRLGALETLDLAMLVTVVQALEQRLPTMARLFEITSPPERDSTLLLAEAKELLFQQNLNLSTRLVEQQQELEALQARHAEMDEQQRLDHLTRLANRAWLEQELARQFDCARRCERSLSLMFIDLDHFKRINDRYGHRFGDEVLVRFARALATMVREHDLAGRYGGEEFLIIMPNTRHGQATALANRIRQYLATQPLAKPEGEPLCVTASIGIASLEEGRGFPDAKTMIDAADQAMYGIKHSGRNGVGLHAGEPDTPS